MFGFALEFLTQHGVLGGHANGAGIEVTLAHHDAPFDHQGCCGETKFIRTEQCANDDVAAGLHLSVCLNTNAAA